MQMPQHSDYRSYFQLTLLNQDSQKIWAFSLGMIWKKYCNC